MVVVVDEWTGRVARLSVAPPAFFLGRRAGSTSLNGTQEHQASERLVIWSEVSGRHRGRCRPSSCLGSLHTKQSGPRVPKNHPSPGSDPPAMIGLSKRPWCRRYWVQMPPIGGLAREGSYVMSDMPAHRAADSGLVELCRCPQSNGGPLVMVKKTWVVLVGSRSFLFLSR